MASPNITWYCHSHVDAVELVASEFNGRAYHCATVEQVDAHLRILRGHIGPKSNFSAAAKALTRRDIDRLLERRTFLRLVGETAA
jgi:hypothetical protein